MFFFFNDTATTEIYTLSLHDALPICGGSAQLIVGEASGGPLMQVSLPLGSNRTTERFVENDPAKKKELQALDEHVKGMMPGWGLSQRASVVAARRSQQAHS